MMICRLCFCAFLLSGARGFILDSLFGSPPQTVQQLDVNKYLGRWYQAFRMVLYGLQRYQRNHNAIPETDGNSYGRPISARAYNEWYCRPRRKLMYASQSVVTLWESGAVCVTADYLQGQNGQITVLNSERLKGGNGTLKVIHGYAKPTGEVGKLTVHLEGVPVNAPYWVLKLGPPTWGPEQKYQYAVVSDNVRGTLFVLARDPVLFQKDYQAELLQFLQEQGFTTFYNKPLSTYHGPDCVYNVDHQ